jgi:hypothetical protein
MIFMRLSGVHCITVNRRKECLWNVKFIFEFSTNISLVIHN